MTSLAPPYRLPSPGRAQPCRLPLPALDGPYLPAPTTRAQPHRVSSTTPAQSDRHGSVRFDYSNPAWTYLDTPTFHVAPHQIRALTMRQAYSAPLSSQRVTPDRQVSPSRAENSSYRNDSSRHVISTQDSSFRADAPNPTWSRPAPPTGLSGSTPHVSPPTSLSRPFRVNPALADEPIPPYPGQPGPTSQPFAGQAEPTTPTEPGRHDAFRHT